MRNNYILAFSGCLACSAMTLLANGFDLDRIGYLASSDINVAIWLFVAHLFETR